MTNEQAKRLAFNEAFERYLNDRSMSMQARSFLQWRIAKNREVTAIDRYVEDLLKHPERPRPAWAIRMFK